MLDNAFAVMVRNNSTKVSIPRDALTYRFPIEGCFVSVFNGEKQRACMGTIQKSDGLPRLMMRACYDCTHVDDLFEPILEN